LHKDELIAFEKEIAQMFEAGLIHSPVHLSGGNENALIEIFKDIKADDWVCSTHRNHYHALLKGVPPELVKQEILNDHSISLNFKEYKFISSAIVGGILPIAVGLAMTGQRVWAFCGDMASHTGIFHECQKYASGHNLPITFVIEDNGMSVDTPTDKTWGNKYSDNITVYDYTRKYPHQGSGKYVTF
jgi:TPP-dependent pyruvate/acetoin dehydrogenase alpha subunit